MKQPNSNHGASGASVQSLSTASPERDLDLYELVAGIAGRWRMIVVMVSVMLVLAIVFLMFTEPRYTSEVRILYGNTEAEVLTSGRQNLRPAVDANLVRSQVQVLQSRDLMTKVIRDLKLTENSEFVSSNEDMGLKELLFIWLGFSSDPRLMSAEERAWMTIAPRLVVYPLPQSRIIALNVWSYDPKIAASIANQLAKVYLNETKSEKSRSNKQATKWLGSRIASLQEKVRNAEAEVERFRGEAGLLQGATSTLSAQELSGIKSQIIVASANKSQAEARARQVRKLLKEGGNINTSNEVLQSPFIRRLREQQITLKRLVADLSSKYLPSHPRMVRLRAEISDLSRQIRAEMDKIVSSLQGQVDVATARIDSLKANLDRVKVTAEQANVNRVRLNELLRDAKASSQLLETYMRRYREASARADIDTQSPNARIISKAYVATTPSYPKKGPILVLLTLGALVLGIMIAFLLEIFSVKPARKETDTTDIQASGVQEPVLQKATLPAFENPVTAMAETVSAAYEKKSETGEAEEIDTAPIQVSVIAELPVILHQNPQQIEIEEMLKGMIQDDKNYRQGIVNLQNFITAVPTAERGTKVLSLSNMHNFDKSMATLALARKLSADGHSVLLIDTDFQMQNLSRSLNIMAFHGITDLITGAALFTDVVIQDTHSSAHIISSGEEKEFRDEDDAETRLDAVVDAFAHAYDFVIVDGGMAYPGAPMWSLTHSSDCSLVFMEHTEAEEVVGELVAQIFDNNQNSVVGIVRVEGKGTVDSLKSLKLFRQDTAA